MERDAKATSMTNHTVDRVGARVATRLFGGTSTPTERVGSRVGRYIVLDKIGSGGMGVVYAAHDRALGRKIALKFVRARSGSGRDITQERARLLHEAQALARVTQANVVAVHDTGNQGDDVWIAMEHVDGKTFREWLREQPRRWTDVFRVMLDVGRGLAAIHAAGLIHRDLKPDNIMVRTDGRGVVMDLGLARNVSVTTTHPTISSEHSSGDDGTTSGAITSKGALMGTPGYMAPEQTTNGAIDARTDLFAYCFVFWEALHGERPVLPELHASRTQAPNWLRRALRRGLAKDPEARWNSVNHLLAALERGQRFKRVRSGALLLACMAALGSLTAGARQWDLQTRSAACSTEGDSIDALWNAEVERRIQEGFTATGVGYATTTAARVIPWITRQAEEWRGERTAACMNAEVYGRWSPEIFERALWCLDERRMAVAALVAEFSTADPVVVQRAVAAAAGLAAGTSCIDEEHLTRLPSPPPHEARETLRSVSMELAQAHALSVAGKPDAALHRASAARERAEREVDWTPLVAKARLVEGRMLLDVGEYPRAESTLTTAYFEAATMGVWTVAADAAIILIHTVGNRLSRGTEGLQWARHSAVAVAEAGDLRQLRQAKLGTSTGLLYLSLGDFPAARSELEHSLALFETELGPDHPETATGLNNLALAFDNLGDHARAQALQERALKIQRRTLGGDHPSVALSLHNLANSYYARGDYTKAQGLHHEALVIMARALHAEHPKLAVMLTNLAATYEAMGAFPEALALLERALAIREKALGPDHTEVANTLNNLANLHATLGNLIEAEKMHKRSLAIREERDPEHPDVAVSLNNLANVLQKSGDLKGALQMHERAMKILIASFGADHPHVATVLLALAVDHQGLGDPTKARELTERSLAVREKALGSHHPSVAKSLGDLARLDLDVTGDPSVALARLERALRIYDAHPGDQEGELLARFTHARALVISGGDQARAVELANGVAERLRKLGAASAQELSDVETWLAHQERGSTKR